MSRSALDDELARLSATLGAEIDLACCPHDAGPPICWCRKPLPGLLLEFARRRGVSLQQSLVVAHSAADRTMAERLGVRCQDAGEFFVGK
jgi:histidinol phosphatase-like enzyme